MIYTQVNREAVILVSNGKHHLVIGYITMWIGTYECANHMHKKGYRMDYDDYNFTIIHLN